MPSTVQVTADMLRGREILVVLLVFLAAQGSFWYPVNGDTSHEFHLSRALGFYSEVEYYAFQVALGLAGYKSQKDGSIQLEVYGDQWTSVLNDAANHLSPTNAEHAIRRFDMEGLIAEGAQDLKLRYDYHLVRLGVRDETYVPNISLQVKENGHLDTKPPPMPGLRAMQRSFKRNALQYIAEIIVDNEELYVDASSGRIRTKAVPGLDASAVKYVAHNPKQPPQFTSAQKDVATPSPQKRQRVNPPGIEVAAEVVSPEQGEGIAHVKNLLGPYMDDDAKRNELLSLMARNIKPGDVKQIDVITGGDHGKGAFIVGSKIVVILHEVRDDMDCSDEDSDSDHEEADVATTGFSFEVSVAEVVCSKDNAEILTQSIKAELTKGLKTVTEHGLVISAGEEEGSIDCTFVEITAQNENSVIKCNTYIVGDLAFYAMMLGRESSSPHHCYICQLSAAEFTDLLREGTPWTYQLMEQYANEYQNQTGRTKKKPFKGCKEAAWWPFIPFKNIIVPLLHCLIGIGNDILTLFRDWISEEIDYLSPAEVECRGTLAAVNQTTKTTEAQLSTFKASPDGVELKRLQDRVKRAKKSLKELDELSSNVGAAVVGDNSPINDYLASVQAFIDDDTAVLDDEDGDDAAAEEIGAADGASGAGAVAGNRIGATAEAIKATVRDCEKAIAPLKKKQDRISNRLSKSKAYAKTLKSKIAVFKRTRKKSGDGIETAIFSVLKSVYDVRIQAYHGGSLTGKDIQKIMAHAEEVFQNIASILKEKARDDCKYDGAQIDTICKHFAELMGLWDGAFSLASKYNPSASDIALYKRFVKAAVSAHIAPKPISKLSITHKVHLMRLHVAHQMADVKGGLGGKREDWLEHLHQITSVKRRQFVTTKSIDTRALSRERSQYQDTDPEICRYIAAANKAACRGPRKNWVYVEAERKKARDEARLETLLRWEAQAEAAEAAAQAAQAAESAQAAA